MATGKGKSDIIIYSLQIDDLVTINLTLNDIYIPSDKYNEFRSKIKNDAAAPAADAAAAAAPITAPDIMPSTHSPSEPDDSSKSTCVKITPTKDKSYTAEKLDNCP